MSSRTRRRSSRGRARIRRAHRAAVAALLIACALIAPASALAVANGRAAVPGRYPWMATLFHVRGGSVFRNERCGATLVAPDRLLTAAHCVVGIKPRALRAYLGLDRLSQRVRRRLDIARFRIMPGYRTIRSPVRPHDERASATANDAALIILGHPVSDVAPVRLAGPLDALLTAPGIPALLLGHGRTLDFGAVPPHRPDPGVASDRLREATQTVLARTSCRATFGRLFGAGQICAKDQAGRPPAAACAGDSGGPLVTQDLGLAYVQIGIVIYGGETQGARCERGRFPVVYTEVAAIRAFLSR